MSCRTFLSYRTKLYTLVITFDGCRRLKFEHVLIKFLKAISDESFRLLEFQKIFRIGEIFTCHNRRRVFEIFKISDSPNKLNITLNITYPKFT